MKLWIYLFLFSIISCTNNGTDTLHDLEKKDSKIEEIDARQADHILGQDIYGNHYIISQSEYRALFSGMKDSETESLMEASYDELENFDSSEGYFEIVYNLVEKDNLEFLPFMSFMVGSLKQTVGNLLCLNT